MAIGSPVSLGSTQTTANVSSLTINTGGSSQAGDLLVVAVALKGTGTTPSVSSVSDGTNSYVLAKAQADANANVDRVELWYKENAAAVSISTNIVITFSGSLGATTHGASAAAMRTTGIRPGNSLDAAAASGNFSSTTVTTLSTTTGTLAQASEIVFGVMCAGVGSAYTESSGGFTNLFSDLNGTNNGALSLGYNIRSATTAVTYNPSVATTTPMAIVAVPFRGQVPFPQPWQMGLVEYTEPSSWRGVPDAPNFLLLGGRPPATQRQLRRFDYVPDAIWVGDPTPTNIRTFPGIMPLPSPVVVPHAREDTIWQGAPIGTNIEAFPSAINPFSKLWRQDVVPDPPWNAVPTPSDTLFQLTANGAPTRPRQWRWDHVPDPAWVWEAPPDWSLVLPATKPFAKFWRYDYVADQIWIGDPTPTNIRTFPVTATPFSKLWRWDFVPDPVWQGTPVSSNIEALPVTPTLMGAAGIILDVSYDTIWQGVPVGRIFPATTKPFNRSWRWDLVPEAVWLGEPQPSNIATLPPALKPFNKLWRWDQVPDTAWTWPPQSSEILYILTASGKPFSKYWRWDLVPDPIWQGEPAPTNIGTFPVVVPPAPGTPQTQFWAPSPPVRTEWQWSPPYNVELFFTPPGAALSGATLGRLLVPPPDWTWTPPYNVQLLASAAVAPFAKLWRWDFTPEPSWKGSPLGSYTLLDLTAGGKPFLKLWRYDLTPPPDWLGEPQPTNIGTFPIVVKPFSNEWAQYVYVPPSDWTWNAPPVYPGRIPGPPPATPQTQFWAPNPPVKTEWQWSPPYNIELFPAVAPQAPFSKQWRYDYVPEPFWVWEPPPDWTLRTPATAPFSKQWRWDYQQDAPWVGAPVSVNIETFPAAGTPFSRLWRYDLTPSPDWTWQPPASGILRTLTAGGAPAHLQWRYDYTPEPFWRGAPVSASYAALKESGKPFTIQWRYDWASGQSWWQGAPIGVNVPIANPGPPIPVPPTTGTGGGERWPPGYRWRWTDFNDRAWLKAFREEFYRLRRLKNPERRRAQFELLEQKFIGAAERALEYETPYEKKLDLVQLGEALQGMAPPASFDRIEMYLVALAAEIDDEEAFLLLND